MRVSCVLDTNVLLVAMAADPASSIKSDATPVDDIALREKVLQWLQDFSESDQAWVLDHQGLIEKEYRGPNRSTRLTEQDYAILIIKEKITLDQVRWVELEVDQHGDARLPKSLSSSVKDAADRKMVAAVLAAAASGDDSRLVNACDTDWFDCEDALKAHGVPVEQLLDTWLRKKWRAKRSK